ncbi:MAG: glycosyltransferase family 39 protein [Planctomyces sp.]|nr:glycosyltransferase family 39 protein [Planctomyces sp.]
MKSSTEPGTLITQRLRHLIVLAALPLFTHWLMQAPVEPIFYGDSNRHVVTSIFFRDLLTDLPLSHPRQYAEEYYEQYPALGLLVWPPLFHGACGFLMLIFGTSAGVARSLVAASFVSSALSVFRLTKKAGNEETATAATILFSILPIVFSYSRDVMLEMPTLALVLLSVESFTGWLEENRSRSLYAASVFAALAALTRFDAVLLIPFYACMLTFHRKWRQLICRHTIPAVVVAVVMLAPVYAVILKEAGQLHLRQASESVGGSVDGTPNALFAAKNLTFYPMALVEQCGWLTAMLCPAGLLIALMKPGRNTQSVFFSLAVATYVTFTPLAELRSRHAIYWLPSAAWFSVVAVKWCIDQLSGCTSRTVSSSPEGGTSVRSGRVVFVNAIVYSILFAATSRASLAQPSWRVEGYSAAAEFVLRNTEPGDKVFFDGWWDGNFTYHMRHLDATRSRYVVRGDRLLYDFVCIPSTDFQQHVETEQEMLQALSDANPVYVVIENPQFYETIEIAERLRKLIASMPEVFEPAQTIPVKTTLESFPRFELQIFRFHRHQAERALTQRTPE